MAKDWQLDNGSIEASRRFFCSNAAGGGKRQKRAGQTFE
jgi:hypothetical protein